MRVTHSSTVPIGLALLAGVLGGCASSAEPILEPAGAAPRWPAPPETPRLVYLGQVTSEDDLKPARGVLDRLGRAVFGATPPRAMVAPIAVCTDGGSRVFVADPGAKLVHVLDLDTRAYAAWEPTDKFSMPVGVAFDPSGRLIVADSVLGCLLVFDGAGVCTGTLGRTALKRPCGVAASTDGRLFVADAGAHQVVVLSAQGDELARVGTRGSDPGQFNYPTNVALGPGGSLYVTDTLNFRVQVFSPRFEPRGQIGSQGDLPGYFAQPKGVALDADGHVYVVDANFEALQIFDPAGALLLAVGHEGHGPGEFWLPAGIHIDPRGRVWIADSYNQRVQVLQYLPEGTRP